MSGTSETAPLLGSDTKPHIRSRSPTIQGDGNKNDTAVVSHIARTKLEPSSPLSGLHSVNFHLIGGKLSNVLLFAGLCHRYVVPIWLWIGNAQYPWKSK